MSSKETNLKEKFRVALNSTAKVIADDFEVNGMHVDPGTTLLPAGLSYMIVLV